MVSELFFIGGVCTKACPRTNNSLQVLVVACLFALSSNTPIFELQAYREEKTLRKASNLFTHSGAAWLTGGFHLVSGLTSANNVFEGMAFLVKMFRTM